MAANIQDLINQFKSQYGDQQWMTQHYDGEDGGGTQVQIYGSGTNSPFAKFLQQNGFDMWDPGNPGYGRVGMTNQQAFNGLYPGATVWNASDLGVPDAGQMQIFTTPQGSTPNADFFNANVSGKNFTDSSWTDKSWAIPLALASAAAFGGLPSMGAADSLGGQSFLAANDAAMGGGFIPSSGSIGASGMDLSGLYSDLPSWAGGVDTSMLGDIYNPVSSTGGLLGGQTTTDWLGNPLSGYTYNLGNSGTGMTDLTNSLFGGNNNLGNVLKQLMSGSGGSKGITNPDGSLNWGNLLPALAGAYAGSQTTPHVVGQANPNYNAAIAAQANTLSPNFTNPANDPAIQGQLQQLGDQYLWHGIPNAMATAYSQNKSGPLMDNTAFYNPSTDPQVSGGGILNNLNQNFGRGAAQILNQGTLARQQIQSNTANTIGLTSPIYGGTPLAGAVTGFMGGLSAANPSTSNSGNNWASLANNAIANSIFGSNGGSKVGGTY